MSAADPSGPFAENPRIVWHTAATNVPRDRHWQVILLTLFLATVIWLWVLERCFHPFWPMGWQASVEA
ncbi:MAG: hypothetical protein HN739_14270 [Gammaproteobacteria bacterium]|nr:hypothetical protein [Gammaproteobacteria bacterium]